MPTIARKTEALNQGMSRHHLGVAVLALFISLVLHATLMTQLSHLPLRSNAGIAMEHKRFVTVELADVLLQPPARDDSVERAPLDQPPANIPVTAPDPDIWSEFSTPEPLRLPLPEPPAPALPSEPIPGNDVLASPIVRQEVLAIPQPLFTEEESTLPRRWVEKDIPKMDHAPDIQLPVEINRTPLSSARINPITPEFVEDMDAGTPDWSAIMRRQAPLGSDGVLMAPLGQRSPDSPFTERPEDVSALRSVEHLLQVKVIGYASETDGELYFKLSIERASDRLLDVQPRDILFIQDSSESMTPAKIDECRRGLKRWLDFMNPGDRFEILGFREDTYACFGQWRDYDETSRREAFAFIDRLRASGNTDVYRSLQSALAVTPDKNRTMLLVLVTDGRPTVGVTGSSDIIEGVTQFNQGRIAMFSVGGGPKVNSFFLDLLSYRNRGEANIVKGDEEIPLAMQTWAQQLRRPVLTDLSYSFSQVDATDVYPKQLTHLFLDRPLTIHGRLPLSAEKLVFQVVGRSGEQWHDLIFAIDREQITRGTSELRSQWAWQKIYHMIGGYLGQPDPEELERIRAFADQYGLVVPYGFSRAMPRRGT